VWGCMDMHPHEEDLSVGNHVAEGEHDPASRVGWHKDLERSPLVAARGRGAGSNPAVTVHARHRHKRTPYWITVTTTC
jgi:hypothetical protein